MTGRSMDPERVCARAQAIAEELGRLGGPITETQAREIAARQKCDCQEGMFALAPTRRGLLHGAGVAVAVSASAILPRTKAPPGAVEYQVPGGPNQGTRPPHGRRRRLWFSLAVRDGCALGKPDPHRLFYAVAGELRHYHAIRPALRTPSRRHSEYRSCQTPPHYPRHGRSADQVLADRSQ